MLTFTGDVCQRMHSHIIESWPFFITFLLICVGFLPKTVVLGKGKLQFACNLFVVLYMSPQFIV